MRRWNGWGEATYDYPLPGHALDYLVGVVGVGTPQRDIALLELLPAIPVSQLPDHPLISVDRETRLLHACGQSLPDWVALRSGLIQRYPDGVAFPQTDDQVIALLEYASSVGAKVIPYGGGTSVVGHITPQPGDAPVLTIDLGRMNQLLQFNAESLLAKFGAGITGPDVEAQLRARGCTLGHFPQSFEYSTLGGWVASRSSGQQSLLYGRIEKLFAGGRMITPAGTLDLAPFPASAAGPDLREMVLGSEGRLGILTEVVVRASRLPQKEEFHAVFFPDFERGMEAVRRVLHAALPLSMLRLSTATETATTLALAGHEALIGALESLLSLRRLGSEKCLLLIGFTGQTAITQAARHEALAITAGHGGIHVGKTFGSQWHKSRFRTPYLRNTMWELGYAIDTLETATNWENVPGMLQAIEKGLHAAIEDQGERVHVFTHLSHNYPSGSSIYTTYLFRLAQDPEETLHRWRLLKGTASQAIVAGGGTISHQHGVGSDHLAYLPAEKGVQGMKLLQTLAACLDPDEMMNPGKLFEGSKGG